MSKMCPKKGSHGWAGWEAWGGWPGSRRKHSEVRVADVYLVYAVGIPLVYRSLTGGAPTALRSKLHRYGEKRERNERNSAAAGSH